MLPAQTTQARYHNERTRGKLAHSRYSGAFSFWYCSTISPAFVERVTPVASFLFPLPRHALVDKTLAIDAPTAFFTRLRCGQALRQASHHAGKEAFKNSHDVPSIFQFQAAYNFARSSKNLERVVDTIGENARFATDRRPHLAAHNSRSNRKQLCACGHCGHGHLQLGRDNNPVKSCNGFSLHEELHSACGASAESDAHTRRAAALLAELPSQRGSGLLSSNSWVECETVNCHVYTRRASDSS